MCEIARKEGKYMGRIHSLLTRSKFRRTKWIMLKLDEQKTSEAAGQRRAINIGTNWRGWGPYAGSVHVHIDIEIVVSTVNSYTWSVRARVRNLFLTAMRAILCHWSVEMLTKDDLWWRCRWSLSRSRTSRTKIINVERDIDNSHLWRIAGNLIWKSSRRHSD